MSSNAYESAIHPYQVQIEWYIALMVVSISFVALRLLSQWYGRGEQIFLKWFRWDGALVVCGFICNILIAATWIVAAKASMRELSTSETPDQRIYDLRTYLIYDYIGDLLYSVATAFPKLSLCALYLRIFGEAHPRLRIITWLMIGFLIINCIIFTILTGVSCILSDCLSDNALQDTPTSKYINGRALLLVYNPPNILSDIVMLALPMVTVWKLNASKTKRVGLVIIFSTGFIGLAGSVARWYSFFPESPSAFDAAEILSLTEPTLYLVAACLPPTPSLLRRAMTAIQSSISRSQKTNSFRMSTPGTRTSERRRRQRTSSDEDVVLGQTHQGDSDENPQAQSKLDPVIGNHMEPKKRNHERLEKEFV